MKESFYKISKYILICKSSTIYYADKNSKYIKIKSFVLSLTYMCIHLGVDYAYYKNSEKRLHSNY